MSGTNAGITTAELMRLIADEKTKRNEKHPDLDRAMALILELCEHAAKDGKYQHISFYSGKSFCGYDRFDGERDLVEQVKNSLEEKGFSVGLHADRERIRGQGFFILIKW